MTLAAKYPRLLVLALVAGFFAFCFQAAWQPAPASGQGMLIDVRPEPDPGFRLPRPILPGPRPLPEPPRNIPQSYKIKELAVNATLADQVAKVQVSQTFVNTGSRQMEVAFIFPLPYDGAVEKLTFMVDGKEFEAKLLSAQEARQVYESYMRRNEDPALLEWMGTGMFKTSVFPVPAGAERTVVLRYSQLLRTSGGLTEFLFPLSTAKFTSAAVEKVSFNVHIQSGKPIKNVYSPSHPVEVERTSNMQAAVSLTRTSETPTSDFRLMFDHGEAPVGANLISYRPDSADEGYFLMLVTPEIPKQSEAVQKKGIIFVIDRSGSMSGKKMEQAKDSLKFVVNNMREGDLFNIIAYDSSVESFKPELQVFNDETRQQALGFVNGLYAGGSTNIEGALRAALNQLQDAELPSYVVFMTDGLPTVNERREPQLVAIAKELNQVRARLLTMGVGYDVNSRLLDKLARDNYGQSEYVKPNEDIEAYVSRIHRRLDSPAMIDVAMKIDVEGADPASGSAVSRVYPRDAYDLFAGDQLVLVGRYKQPGAAKITVSGKVAGEAKSFDFGGELIDKSHDETYAFVEKLWAMRRVGDIIDEIDLVGKNDELVDELVELSKRHGIMTPYTAFLAEEPLTPTPEGQRGPELAARLRDRAGANLDALGEAADGEAGVAQRAAKGEFQRAAQAPAAGNAVVADEKRAGGRKTIETVQNVGSKTFFRRGEQWVDSTLTEEQEKNAVEIERFSPEYFNLAADLGRDAAKYLAVEGKVIFQFKDKTYRVR